MQEKRRRQWPNLSSMSPPNNGPSFGASAHAGLSAPASNSTRTGTIVREETITLEEKHAIDRVGFFFSPQLAPPSNIPLQK